VRDASVSWQAEATQYGVMLLPDRSAYGPLYICRLRRTA
jgi:hypothetical protein